MASQRRVRKRAGTERDYSDNGGTELTGTGSPGRLSEVDGKTFVELEVVTRDSERGSGESRGRQRYTSRERDRDEERRTSNGDEPAQFPPQHTVMNLVQRSVYPNDMLHMMPPYHLYCPYPNGYTYPIMLFSPQPPAISFPPPLPCVMTYLPASGPPQE